MSIPPDCDSMTEMATSTILRISLIINLIFVIFAIPVILLAFSYLKIQKLFHVNTRIQVQVHLFGILLHLIGRFFLHSFDLFNYFSSFTNGCEVMPDFYRCFITRGLYNIGISLSAMCCVSLTIERSVAVIFSDSYEYCPKTFGYALGGLQFLLSFCFLFKLYYSAPFTPDGVVLYYCQTLASGNGSVWTVNAPLYAVLITQIVSRIIFHFLRIQSKKMRFDHTFLSLSRRYNLEQGIRSIHALNMFVNANTFVFMTLAIVGTTLHFHRESFKKPHYFAIVEAIHFIPVYGIILSFSVYLTLKKLDRRLKISLAESIQAKPDHYFEVFNKQIG